IIREHNCKDIPIKKIKAVFVVSSGLDKLKEEIQDLQIHNAYCETEVTVCPEQSYRPETSDDNICFFISKDENGRELAKRLGFRKRYFIQIGEESAFLGKEENIFCYRSSEEDFFDAVFSCFLLGTLPAVFQETLRHLPQTIQNRYTEKLAVLQSIYPAV